MSETIYGAKKDDWPGYVAVLVDHPKCKKETAKELADWIKRGWKIEQTTRPQAVAGLNKYSQEQKRRSHSPPLPEDGLFK